MDSVVPVLATIYINVINVTLDPSISLRDTAHLLKLVRPKLILVEQNSVDLIECASRQANFNTEIVVIGSSDKYSTYADFLQPKSKTMEDNFVPANVDDVKNTAAIFFSSGTTGLPKGIEISHYSMIYMVEMIL